MKLRAWTARLRCQTAALYLAGRDARTPWLAKALVATALAYALSPIDLIPDFIPVLGQLDDLILVPLLVWLAIRMVPRNVWRECVEQASRGAVTLPTGITRRSGWYVTALILIAVAVGWWVLKAD